MNYETDGIAMIMNRRSCKNYLPQLPERHLIAEVVEAGRSAPSGMNRQMCHFLVITRQKLLSQLSDLVSRRLEPFARRDFRYAAPVMVVLCHQKSVTVALQDAGCAMENMLLAAYSLGMGAR